MIIIGGLIVFSILWCIIRCACCGMSCCCSCFSFLKCCDCCGDSCAGKKNKPMKHLDDPFSQPGPQPGPRQGYQAPVPMMGGALGGKPDLPQYAQFEVGKNGLFVEPKTTALSEDALPPMPSWDTAAKKRIPTEEEKNAVELGELDPATGQQIPLMSGAAAAGNSAPPSPHDPSPFGPRPTPSAGGNGYMGVQGDQYAQNQNAYNQNAYNVPGAYDRTPSPGQGGQPRFGSPGPGMNGQGRGYGPQNGQGRGDYGSPAPQYGQGRGYGPPSPQDPYAQDSGFIGTAGGADGYGRGDGYGRALPQGQYSNDGRSFPPQPVRQYSSDSSRPLNPGRGYSDRSDRPGNLQPQGGPRGPSRGPGGPNRMASPPLNNNSGFDFGTGAAQQQYSSRPSPPPQQASYDSPNNGRRPSQPSQRGGNGGYYNGGSTAPPSYASRSPPPQENSAYPGYQAYQPPSSQGGRGNGRGGREPQGWDPVRQ